MKRILIYGDSNSWGYLDDGQGQRFDRRWPVEMCRHLSKINPVSLIEECLPGRTTNIDDPVMGNAFNGLTPLETVLLSHQPLDHIVIMLGTNDLKARFSRSAEDIAAAAVELAKMARSVPAGRGGWARDQTAEVSLVCPLVLGQKAGDPMWERANEWAGATEKSEALASAFQTLCSAAKIRLIDGNLFGQSSLRDPIHWEAQTHLGFGQGMARALQPQLS